MGLVAMHRLCLVPETAGHFPAAESARASHCGGFSCCGAWALGTWASVAVAHGLSSCSSWTLEHWLNSCGAWA